MSHNREIVKERTLTDACRNEMIKLIDKDFSKYRAQGIIEKMITAVMEISTYRQRVTVFSIFNPEPLDFYILSSLMQSSGRRYTFHFDFIDALFDLSIQIVPLASMMTRSSYR